MYLLLALIGVCLLAMIGIIIGFGSFLPWIIIPICLGLIGAAIFTPWIKWGLETKTQENKEFDKEHGIK